MARNIQLTNGMFAIVDDEDYEYLNQFKWCSFCGHNTFYSIKTVKINGKKTTITMHRFLLGAKKGQMVDHIDGNGLNNQKSNLRLCTNSENLCNKRKPITNNSGYKGVCWSSAKHKWKAHIYGNKKPIHLGYFNCLIKAVKTYNEAAIEYHGEFAKINKI